MSAHALTKRAKRSGTSATEGMTTSSLNRGWDYNRSPGLKKGARRARRRVDKKTVEDSLLEGDATPAEARAWGAGRIE